MAQQSEVLWRRGGHEAVILTESEHASEAVLAWLMAALKWSVSLTLAAWVSMAFDLKMLVVLSAVDVTTTLFNAQRQFALTTKRLALMFLLVLTVHFLYSIAKTQTGLNLGFDVGAVVCTYYALGEAIIIIRNFVAAGLKIPPQLLDLLSHAEGLTGVERREITALKLKQDQEGVALELKLTQKNEGEKNG